MKTNRKPRPDYDPAAWPDIKRVLGDTFGKYENVFRDLVCIATAAEKMFSDIIEQASGKAVSDDVFAYHISHDEFGAASHALRSLFDAVRDAREQWYEDNSAGWDKGVVLYRNREAGRLSDPIIALLRQHRDVAAHRDGIDPNADAEAWHKADDYETELFEKLEQAEPVTLAGAAAYAHDCFERFNVLGNMVEPGHADHDKAPRGYAFKRIADCLDRLLAQDETPTLRRAA